VEGARWVGCGGVEGEGFVVLLLLELGHVGDEFGVEGGEEG
jgi:hypothetical protein